MVGLGVGSPGRRRSGVRVKPLLELMLVDAERGSLAAERKRRQLASLDLSFDGAASHARSLRNLVDVSSRTPMTNNMQTIIACWIGCFG
jgi:hypothetical protein